MQFKKLAIISDCVHVFNEKGIAATENVVFMKQMQAIAVHFDETLICCPFEIYTSNKILSCYTSNTIQFIALPNVGGNRIADKIKLLRTIPKWWKAFKKANSFADIVYQRFPNNLNIPGFFYFYFKKAKVFAMYAGTWKNYSGEPFTYRLQKWLLKKYFRGPVWIYTDSVITGNKFQKNFSPSYTLHDWLQETEQVQYKIQALKEGTFKTPVFLTVGALVEYKNQQFILEACKILYDTGFGFQLFIAGDGPLKENYRQFITNNKLENCIFLAGRKNEVELRDLYRKADFLIQAPTAEGFGKAPMEGFFHGVIPILNNIGLAEMMTGNDERGFLFSTGDPSLLARLIKNIFANKKILASMIENGREYARLQTLENWSSVYYQTITSYFG